tara:strand:+ start:629 stop:1141 length:513 start_codon:yes stop_codon:yes gene_type:complete
MNILKKLITIFIVLFILISSSHSQDQIVYLNLDNVVNNTKAGKIILKNLEKSKNNALLKFKNKEQELKKIENEINKQKNIISEDELKKKLVEFRKELSIFRQERQNVINEFNKKKTTEFNEFFKKITPIIENYVSEKNIDMVLDKKDIFVANKKKDITGEIIKLIDTKIK